MKARSLVITVSVCLLAGITFSQTSAEPPVPYNEDRAQPVVTPVPSPTPFSQLEGGFVINDVLSDILPPPAPEAVSSPTSVFVLDDLTFSNSFDVTANFTSSAPTINGRISSGEWDDAGVYDITVPGRAFAVTLYAMNDGEHLYLAMDNPNDTTINVDDQIGVYFDDNPLPSDGRWTNTSCGHPDGEGNFWVLMNRVIYREWIAGPATCEAVEPAPGTLGALGYGSGHAQAEIAIDLTSSALRATPGDIINMYMWIYDDGTGLYGGSWPSTADFQDPATYGQLTLEAHSAGNVYLPVVLKNFGPSFCDPYEPNDSRSAPWGPWPRGQTINAQICQGDPRDIYYFNASGSVRVTINLTNMPGNVNFDLYLWDESGSTPLAKSENGAGQNEQIVYTLPGAGRYYVDIYPWSGTGSYTLQGSGW